MTRRITLCLLPLALLASEAAFASCSSNSGTGQSSCNGPLARVYVPNDGGVVFLEVAGTVQSQLSCTLASGIYWRLEKSIPNFNEQYALALTAAAVGADVRAVSVHNNAGSACRLNYLVLMP